MNIITSAYLTYRNLYRLQKSTFVIGRLFKKKQYQIKEQLKQNQKQKQQKERDQEDQLQYDLEARRRQIANNIDFRQLKNIHKTFIPSEINKGGFDQIVYWSQNVKTPQQIYDILIKFNKEDVPQKILDQHRFQQFKQKVISIIMLIPSISKLKQIALFGSKFESHYDQFWNNIQNRIINVHSLASQQLKQCIDIIFLMGKLRKGEYIYNHIEQILKDRPVQLEDTIKLLSAFCLMKKGNKNWISSLISQIFASFNNLTAETLGEFLFAFKQFKSANTEHYVLLQNKIIELIENLKLLQICEAASIFGYDKGSQKLWNILEQKVIKMIKQQKTSQIELQKIITKILTTYKFSTQFVQNIILQKINKNNFQILNNMKISSLSSLSKILHIYELDNKTEPIERYIQSQIINYYKNLDNVKPWEFIDVLKDYTVTRHGSRQIYIFFEEVIKADLEQFITNRQVIEALIIIYQNSSLCSPDLLETLNLAL